MVKGVSRRVVVVQPENREMFDQAIFLVRDFSMPQREVVREACRIADRYLQVRVPRRRYRGWQLAVAFASGAVLCGAVWALCALL